jgi:5-carboxymethyl-2-hydroxymuconate isomerase
MPHFIIDCSESILSLADPDELMQSVYAAAEKKALSEEVVRTLKRLLPEVDIISVNIREFEKATYCNASTIEISNASR